MYKSHRLLEVAHTIVSP